MIMQSPEDQLSREFGKEEFCLVVDQLMKLRKIKGYMPPDRIYDQIVNSKGKVLGYDLAEAVQNLEEKTQQDQDLSQQLEFYRLKLNDFQKQGCSSITLSDFKIHFIKSNPHQGVISQEIMAKLKQNSDYISIEKLKQVIKKIEKMTLQNKPIQYPSQIQSLEKSNIYIDDNLINSTSYGKKFQEIQIFIENHVLDPMVKDNLEKMIHVVKESFEKAIEEKEESRDVTEKVNKYKEELEEQMYEMEREIIKKNEEIIRLEEKCRKQFEDLQEKIKKEKELIIVVSETETRNDELMRDVSRLSSKNEELSESVQWFRTNYRELSTEFEGYLNKVKDEQKREQTQNQKRLFRQKTTKQQLEEAHSQINRLRGKNTEIQQKLGDQEASYEARINILQEKIKQLEECQQTGRISQRFSHFTHLNQSRLSGRVPVMENSAVQDFSFQKTESVIQPSRIQQSRMKSSLVSSILQSVIQEENKNAFRKKKVAISEAVSVIFPPESENQLNQYDEIGILTKHKEFSDLTQILIKESVVEMNEEKKGRGIYSTNAHIITESGANFLKGLIFSSDRMTILDTKMRFEYSIKFSKIRKIFFCHHNITWVVFKLHEREKSQKQGDLVISLRNRSELIEYLYRNCIQELKKSRTSIKFQKEDNIWLKSSGKDVLLSNFGNYYNIHRVSINNAHHIFQANVKQESKLFGSSDVLMIVCSIGILCFENIGTQLIESKPTLVLCLPLVQKMQVIELSKENKIKLFYETEDKSFRIKLSSWALTKKLKKIIDEQRSQSFEWKLDLVYNYSQMTDISHSKKSKHK